MRSVRSVSTRELNNFSEICEKAEFFCEKMRHLKNTDKDLTVKLFKEKSFLTKQNPPVTIVNDDNYDAFNDFAVFVFVSTLDYYGFVNFYPDGRTTMVKYSFNSPIPLTPKTFLIPENVFDVFDDVCKFFRLQKLV